MGYPTLPPAAVPDDHRAPISPWQGFQVYNCVLKCSGLLYQSNCINFFTAAVELCFPWGISATTPVLWHSGAALTFYQTQTFNRTFMYYCKGMKRSTKKIWITPHASSSHIEYCHPQSTIPRNWSVWISKHLLPSCLRSWILIPPQVSFITSLKSHSLTLGRWQTQKSGYSLQFHRHLFAKSLSAAYP